MWKHTHNIVPAINWNWDAMVPTEVVIVHGLGHLDHAVVQHIDACAADAKVKFILHQLNKE